MMGMRSSVVFGGGTGFTFAQSQVLECSLRVLHEVRSGRFVVYVPISVFTSPSAAVNQTQADTYTTSVL